MGRADARRTHQCDLETLTLSATPDLQGLQTLLNQELGIHDRVHELKTA